MSRFFDLWPQLTQSVGADLRVILALRHPMEVAQSLARRNGMKIAHSLALWLRHTLESERTTRHWPRALQHYSNLLIDWRQEFERLDCALELSLPIRTPDQEAEIDSFLDGGLRHHQQAANWAGWENADSVSCLCAKAFKAMSTFPREDTAITMDAIAAEFDEWERQANSLCGQVAYHLTLQHQQDETIRWLEGERAQVIAQAQQDIAGQKAQFLLQSETIQLLREERERLAESHSKEVAGYEARCLLQSEAIQSLEDERDRLTESHSKEVAGYEARCLLQSEAIQSLEDERDRLTESHNKEVAGYEARCLLQSDKIQSIEEERDRLAESHSKEVAGYEARCLLQSDKIQSLEEECARLLATVREETSQCYKKDADLLLANRRIEQIEIDLRDKESALDAMYRSNSWRITAPMRGVVNILRRPPARPVERLTNVLGTPSQTKLAEMQPSAWTPNTTTLRSFSPASDISISEKKTLRISTVRPSHKRTRILIVTPDIHGPIRNGGIGTAFSALSIWCARWGYEVSILYALGDYTENETIAHWQKHYSDLGVKLIALNSFELGETPELQGSYCGQFAWKVDIWLRTHGQRFDLAIFPEWMGLAYYALLRKGQGLAHSDLTIAVNAHSPENWALEGNRGLPDNTDVLEREFMERESVRRADWVISPSEYLFDWMQKHQWSLPARRLVVQNLLSEPSYRAGQTFDVEEISELVFFGRLEFRKGLKLFCDSIDLMPPTHRERVRRVVFMGKASVVLGYDSAKYIQLRSAAWNIPVEICTNRNREQALNYLARPGVLAIIASLSENSPYTVLECLHHKIRFLATSVGGIPELVHADDRDETLFDPNPGCLHQKIARALERGSTSARMAQPQEKVREDWLTWLQEAAKINATDYAPIADRSAKAQPLISVCLVHYNRPTLLAQALDSLRAQTYQNFEVVLVDDGSPSETARAFLDSLEPEFDSRNWKIIRQSNRYLGAARNQAAQAATGDYLFFMDDDNIAAPTELDVFAEAAIHSGADILTCFAHLFHDDALPSKALKIWAPLGGAAGPGLYRNVFGDANALWKRDAFLRIGGYTTDYGVGHEDWELFAEAVLSGLRLEVVPEPLFWYRIHPGSMLRNGDVWADHARSVRPYVRHDSAGMGLANAYAACLLQSRNASMKMENAPLSSLGGKRELSGIVLLAASDPKNVVRFLLTWKKQGLRHATRMSVMKSRYRITRATNRRTL